MTMATLSRNVSFRPSAGALRASPCTSSEAVKACRCIKAADFQRVMADVSVQLSALARRRRAAPQTCRDASTPEGTAPRRRGCAQRQRA